MHFEIKDVLARLRPGGCAQPYIETYTSTLMANGYALLSSRQIIRSASHLGRWLDSRRLPISEVSPKTIAEFSQHRCQCPGARGHGKIPSRRYVARLRGFVDHLQTLKVILVVHRSQPPTHSPLLGEFREWMIGQRGVKSKTVNRYESLVARMLPALGNDPAIYDAALVRRVFLDEIRDLSQVYAKCFISALRAFLRFLAAKGLCRPYLDRAVPTIPVWKLSALPRYLPAKDVERVIASCDLGKPHGVRDRAILLLLARLGLRAGDVASMKLSDLDWKHGTLRLQGKSRQEIRLPLPQEIGDAILNYLLDIRPKAKTDHVFLCVQAPIRPFGNSAVVSGIVRLALKRAGITDSPSSGAHLLRHSAATTMLRDGASLDSIGTMLRHKSIDTTAYYAKVDVKLLRSVAQPWPEGGAQ